MKETGQKHRPRRRYGKMATKKCTIVSVGYHIIILSTMLLSVSGTIAKHASYNAHAKQDARTA